MVDLEAVLHVGAVVFDDDVGLGDELVEDLEALGGFEVEREAALVAVEVPEIGAVAGAAEAGIAVVPQGGNTGLVEGSIPTESRPTIVISTDRMTKVRNLDPENFAMVAEAGCIIQNLQGTALDAGRLFPLSLASEGSCTVGGTL